MTEGFPLPVLALQHGSPEVGLVLATTLRPLARRRSDLARNAEIVILRQELAVLRREPGWV